MRISPKLHQKRTGSASAYDVLPPLRYLGRPAEECTLCGLPGTPDEYHLLFVCKKFENRRKILLPGLYQSSPNIIKYDQLMNTNNIKLLKNLSVLCGAIHDMLLHTSAETMFSSLNL